MIHDYWIYMCVGVRACVDMFMIKLRHLVLNLGVIFQVRRDLNILEI